MSSGAYKAVGGKLKFKGAARPAAASASASANRALAAAASGAATSAAPVPAPGSGPAASAAETHEVTVSNGAGRITSSGTTVHGHGTEFMAQLSVGDAIIITHPSSLQEETKIVRMVLSNVSIGISSEFSSDLITTTSFRFIKAPKDEVSEEDRARQALSRAHKVEEDAFGTYASKGGTVFNYRVKKAGAFGGYAIVSQSTDGEMSREQLLDARAKKKADRFCY